jgi:glucosylceramidase
MKVNRHYAGMPAPVNDLPPERAGREMQTQFRMEPQVLSSYADYFVKFIEAYRKEGVAITSVHVQNEPNSCQNFPSCVWRPEDLALFIGEYLGPRFEKAGVTASIWLGTVERPHVERVETILESTAGRYIRGVGLQWAGRGLVEELHRRRPQLPLMQTETECGNGSNDWAAAEHTWDQMQHYFRNGAGAYMYWNMVLDETGNSRWGWRQNAMITVDRASRTVRYNPEYFLMRHFSQWIKRGAHFLTVPGIGGQVLAFRNPDGKHVLVMANLTQHPLSYSVRLPSRSAQLTLPPGSFSTFVE